MRIAHYMRKMFEPGGIASYIRRISAAQRARGHDTLYFDRASDAMPTPERIEYVTGDADLARRAQALGVDLLHLHCTIDHPPAGVPLVRTVHTHAPYCPSQGRFLKNPSLPCDRNYTLAGCLWGHAVNRCGSVRPAALVRNFKTVRTERRTLRTIPTIVVSDFLKQQMIRAGYPAAGIEVVHLPAPTTTPPYTEPPHDGPPRFVFLGRMIPHKGVDWLLRAATAVRSDVRIDLAGTGNQEQEYRTLASQLNLGDRVRFHGWLTGPAIDDLLRGARALIFPSIWHEPGGTVAFEAMTNGRAVITSRVGGIPEVVRDGENGLLVEPGDIPGLAHAMDQLANDYPLGQRLGQRGRELATHRYTMDAHVDRLMALYAQAVRADVGGAEPAATHVR